MNACQAPLAVCARPTGWSPKCDACASLEWPPNVPRSWRDRASAEKPANSLEDVVHHLRCQFSGVRVLATRVIAADERVAVGQRVRDTVAEKRFGTNHETPVLQQIQIRVEADLPQRDDEAD